MKTSSPHRRRPPTHRLGLFVTAAATVLVGTGCTGPVPGRPIVLPENRPAATTVPGSRPTEVAATGTVGGPGATAGPSATAGPGGTGRCPASGVLLSATETNAAMGLRAMAVVLFNCGTEPFPLNGYPVVRVLDAERNLLPVTIEIGSRTGEDPGPREIVVNPGGTAHAELRWRNTVTFGDLAQGEYLEVAPAAEQPTQTVPKSMDLGTTGRLEVHAWSTS